MNHEDLDGDKEITFKILWKAQVPFKIKAFGWKTFLNRLLSKDHLRRRGIISSNH